MHEVAYPCSKANCIWGGEWACSMSDLHAGDQSSPLNLVFVALHFKVSALTVAVMFLLHKARIFAV